MHPTPSSSDSAFQRRLQQSWAPAAPVGGGQPLSPLHQSSEARVMGLLDETTGGRHCRHPSGHRLGKEALERLTGNKPKCDKQGGSQYTCFCTAGEKNPQKASRARGNEAGSRIHKELKLIAKRRKRNDWRDNVSKRGYTDGQEMCREGPSTVSHRGNTSQNHGTWYRTPKRMTAAKGRERITLPRRWRKELGYY